MTNEEKAREISSKYIYTNEVMHYEYGDVVYESETFGEETEDAALEMAEWKDQQFKEYLEKKMEAYREKKHRASFANNKTKELICFIKSKVIDEIINELFTENEIEDYSNKDE